MSWPITLHESRPESPRVGDMWPAPWLVRDALTAAHWLSQDYITKRASQRPPLVVRLPGSLDFCIDTKDAGGWEISGVAPAVTLSPSIDHPGTYHGWIRDGVITDDCEGRKFPADPPTYP